MGMTDKTKPRVELPEAYYQSGDFFPDRAAEDYYTADQMHAYYAKGCADALARSGEVTDAEALLAIDAYEEAVGEGWQLPCTQGMRAALTAFLAAQRLCGRVDAAFAALAAESATKENQA